MINLARPQREYGRAETIAERKARLAYDREHPWTPITQAVVDGTVCELQFADAVGNFDGGERRFVLIRNPRWGWKEWVCVMDAHSPYGRPCGFRPTDKVLSKAEMARLARRRRW
jgi:hypothetical protein